MRIYPPKIPATVLSTVKSPDKVVAAPINVPPDTVNPPVAEATVILAVPSKDTPPIVRAVANAVAVAEFPVHEPDEPEWAEMDEHKKTGYRKEALIVMNYLHSQGVVIKVEDWLPVRDGMTCTVEPLIEE